jgi:hypothetical protein
MGSTPNSPKPSKSSYSLASVFELISACLDAAGAKTVLEVGAFQGDLTADLLDWAADSGAHVGAVDPTPPQELLALRERRPELELIRETSHEALAHLELPDAIIIDGDHNHFTLTEELRLIDERATGAETPLLMFHDVSWPHARRDTYYAPERIPEEHRQPLAHDVCIAPGEPGVTDQGIRYEWAAEREGGPGNGVLTAIDDHIGDRDDLRLAVVPAFFGFGVLWNTGAPWAEAVATIVDPWDRNPILERLEADRVAGLCARLGLASQLDAAQERITMQEHLLREMLGSSAFALGDRLAGLRHRGSTASWRAQVEQVLGERNR